MQPSLLPEKTPIIRSASVQDIPTIIQLAHDIWPKVYKEIILPEHLSNILLRMYDPAFLEQEFKDGQRFWIVETKDDPIGYASCYREDDIVWIKKLYIDPDYQGSGLGRKLITIMESEFPATDEARLLVNPNNDPAMRFYHHLGFTQIGTQPVQMGDHVFEDKIFSRPIESK